MKRYAIFCLFLAMAALFSACSLPAAWKNTDEAVESDTFSVYRMNSDPEKTGELIRPEPVPEIAADGMELDTAMAFLASPAMSADLACALPEGVSITGYGFENGVVTLSVSDGFLGLTEMQKTIASFCAVLTLCQLSGVEAVTILCGDETVFSGLMPEDALLTAEDTDPYIRRLRLYFPDAEGRYLISEYHSLTLEEDASPERYVLEELLRGPNNGELQSAIPEGTRLLSCTTSGGVCTVDLSSEFYTGRPDTALGERLAVYSIVDSLTAIAAVESVRLSVEGTLLEEYVFLPLDAALTRYEEAIGPVSAPKGEFDADLYLALPGLTGVAPLPFRVSQADYESRAEAVLARLLSAAEPGYPALFPSNAAVSGVSVRDYVCTVDLSEGFFASIPEDERAVAVESMSATLCSLDEIRSVRFTIGGESAVFDGVDWSGAWYGVEP